MFSFFRGIFNSTEKKINRALENAAVMDFTDDDKFVIISDAHRGTGDNNDSFAPNRNIYFHALESYNQKAFTYIELGDGDELWQNKSMEAIVQNHSDVFWQLNRFNASGRLIMLYGNHDMVKRNRRWRGAHFSAIREEYTGALHPLLPGLRIAEGLVLRHKRTGAILNLIHGHQADPLCSTFWRLGRFLVRYVWRPLESLGVKQPQGTAEQRAKKEKTEIRLIKWCEENDAALIAGHTHRTWFPGQNPLNCAHTSVARYFNSGSCVHPRCITAIEIENGMVSLVKWSVETRPDASLYIARTVLQSRTVYS